SLQEGGIYETVGGNKVEIQGSFELEEMLTYYQFELSQILNIGKKSESEREKILSQQQIVYGLIDDGTSNGLWHAQSGKCLGGSTKGETKGKTKVKKNISGFDIHVE
ncbi:MAG: hypothetical protein WCO66_02790, partial [Candidatus Absconditabacteria bacterium]